MPAFLSPNLVVIVWLHEIPPRARVMARNLPVGLTRAFVLGSFFLKERLSQPFRPNGEGCDIDY
jgi:hypothetical protein